MYQNCGSKTAEFGKNVRVENCKLYFSENCTGMLLRGLNSINSLLLLILKRFVFIGIKL